MKNIVQFVMLSVILAFNIQAKATVIDFESLSKSDDSVTFLTGSYIDSGYIFTAENPTPYSFATVGDLHPRFGGSTSFSTFNYTSISIKNTSNAYFDFTSWDVAPVFLGQNDPFGPDRIVGVDYQTDVYGFRNGESIIMQSISLPNDTPANVLTSIDMIGFEQIDEIIIFANAFPGIQFDNLALNVSAVPEPSTYALLFLGLATIYASKRRTKNRA